MNYSKINKYKLSKIKNNDKYIINHKLEDILKKMDAYIFDNENYITFNEFDNLIKEYINKDNIYNEINDKKSKYFKLKDLYENNYEKEEIEDIIKKGSSGFPNKLVKHILEVTKKRGKYNYYDSD